MKQTQFFCALVTITCMAVLAPTALAEAPKLISYQGRATDASGNPVADGVHPVQFHIYDKLNNLYWTESASVTTSGGLFSHNLGSVTPLDPTDFNWRDSLFLQVTFEGQVQNPRTLFTASPYAYHVNSIDGSAGGIVIGSISVNSPVADDEVAGIAIPLSGSPNFWMKDVDGVNRVKLDAATRSLEFVDGAVTSTPAKITSQDSTVVIPKARIDNNLTVSGNAQFGGGVVHFADSTMTVNNNGVRIGDDSLPYWGHLLHIQRTLAGSSSQQRYGQYMKLRSSGSFELNGVLVDVGSVNDAGNETRHGVIAVVNTGNSSGGSAVGGEFVAGAGSRTAGHNYGIDTWAYCGSGSTAYGIRAGASGTGTRYAGYFIGDVAVNGTLSKSGGSFTIDHPLDPENKYLQHSFVESPDMMNVYNGNVTLDASGEATVVLPNWFEALNKDFRYQLTAIGAPGPNLYIAQKVTSNQFTIAGGTAGMEVSWQVTGIRQDKWANANRIQVEIDKDAADRGKYLHPTAYGQPEEKGVDWKHREATRDKGASSDTEEE